MFVPCAAVLGMTHFGANEPVNAHGANKRQVRFLMKRARSGGGGSGMFSSITKSGEERPLGRCSDR